MGARRWRGGPDSGPEGGKREAKVGGPEGWELQHFALFPFLAQNVVLFSFFWGLLVESLWFPMGPEDQATCVFWFLWGLLLRAPAVSLVAAQVSRDDTRAAQTRILGGQWSLRHYHDSTRRLQEKEKLRNVSWEKKSNSATFSAVSKGWSSEGWAVHGGAVRCFCASFDLHNISRCFFLDRKIPVTRSESCCVWPLLSLELDIYLALSDFPSWICR